MRIRLCLTLLNALCAMLSFTEANAESAQPCPVTSFQRANGMQLLEGRGASSGETAWALLFGFPVRAKLEEKIVIRMTGRSDLSVYARRSSGTVVRSSWGPVRHLSSKWHRPGDEWGMAFTFPNAGCWDVHATRGSAFADWRLQVQRM